jgi:hypothetical protein
VFHVFEFLSLAFGSGSEEKFRGPAGSSDEQWGAVNLKVKLPWGWRRREKGKKGWKEEGEG